MQILHNLCGLVERINHDTEEAKQGGIKYSFCQEHISNFVDAEAIHEGMVQRNHCYFPDMFCTCRIQNPDIPRAGRVGAAHGGAAGRGRAG